MGRRSVPFCIPMEDRRNEQRYKKMTHRKKEHLELLADIKKARAQAKRGETMPHDQALDYLIARFGQRESNG